LHLLPEKKRVAYEQLTAFSSLYKLCAYELNPGLYLMAYSPANWKYHEKYLAQGILQNARNI